MVIELETNRESISLGPEDVIRCIQAARRPTTRRNCRLSVLNCCDKRRIYKVFRGASNGTGGMHKETIEAVKLVGMAL